MPNQLVWVPFKKLSRDMKAIAETFQVIYNKQCLVEACYANSPKQSPAVYSIAGERCDEDTPLPYVLTGR